MQVEIVSAEGNIFSGKASHINLNAEHGGIGIYRGHAPMMTTIKPGPIHIYADDGSEEVVFVSGGFIEVQPSIVTVLADTVIRVHDADEAQIAKSRQEAEDALLGKSGKFDSAKAKADLAHMTGLLKAIKEMRKVVDRSK